MNDGPHHTATAAACHTCPQPATWTVHAIEPGGHDWQRHTCDTHLPRHLRYAHDIHDQYSPPTVRPTRTDTAAAA